MAFNFNWSPLIADTSRARDMLTTALNKSPKPPIIVDDIIVTELNLGTTPPELEILEVGDLAEDRFRGIFKMTYTGDAFLTLKTKVQANPLNTYLSTRSDFASPQPLAAASGLEIPLRITLSDIRLSGFVILVFSKQKGVTLVFRNDPLESLKVSSTFDSVPFVRDYLQKEIEGQLRALFMDDLPAIIHRLSLRLCSPEFQEIDAETEERLDGHETTAPIDPLSTPPHDAVDAFGNPIDNSSISTLSLDSSEMHASFSQKNMIRLAALSESQRTLSLFTPGIRDAVFRAWASNPDRTESGATTPALTLSSLSRIQSTFGSIRSQGSSVASGSTGHDTQSTRPTLVSNYSAPSGLSLNPSRGRGHQMRKRKKRVVDLRKTGDRVDSSAPSSATHTPVTSTYGSETTESIILEEREKEEELTTPPKSPLKPGLRFEGRHGSLDVGEPSRVAEKTINADALLPPAPLLSDPPKLKSKQNPQFHSHLEAPESETKRASSRPPLSHNRLRSTQQATSPLLRSLSFDRMPSISATASGKAPLHSPPYAESTASSGGILEQAWMLKMAHEIAKKVQEEKGRASRETSPHTAARSKGMWAGRLDDLDAPPAYVA